MFVIKIAHNSLFLMLWIVILLKYETFAIRKNIVLLNIFVGFGIHFSNNQLESRHPTYGNPSPNHHTATTMLHGWFQTVIFESFIFKPPHIHSSFIPEEFKFTFVSKKNSTPLLVLPVNMCFSESQSFFNV